LLEGANTLQLKSVNGTSLVESLRINYNRRHLAQQNRLSFYTQNYRGAVVEGFSSANIRVFDITHSNSPSVAANFLIKQDGSNYSVVTSVVSRQSVLRGRRFGGYVGGFDHFEQSFDSFDNDE
jgi:hypothetical protein